MRKTEEKQDKKQVTKKVIKSSSAGKNDERVDILAENKTKDTIKEKKSDQKKEISEVKARARFLRTSPRKAKLIVDLIRGLNIDQAIGQLSFTNKGASKPVLKLLNSAVANAEHNFKLNKDDLYIKYIVANQGPTLHRWQPAAFGRAHPIRKRSTHLEITLGLKKNNLKIVQKPKVTKMKTSSKVKGEELANAKVSSSTKTSNKKLESNSNNEII